MRKVIMWNLVTLDGFFEGQKSWDLGFHDSVWGEELEQYSLDQSKSTDMLLFGRVTYEGMASSSDTNRGENDDVSTPGCDGPCRNQADIVLGNDRVAGAASTFAHLPERTSSTGSRRPFGRRELRTWCK